MQNVIGKSDDNKKPILTVKASGDFSASVQDRKLVPKKKKCLASIQTQEVLKVGEV